MNKTTINHIFDVGDEVYHITPDSPKAYILEWLYSSYSQQVKYKITSSIDNDLWCYEIELTTEKTF